MKHVSWKLMALLTLGGGCGASWAGAAETLESALQRSTLDYTSRLVTAAEELNAARGAIDREKLPMLRAMRLAEDRIVAAESAMRQLSTGHEEADSDRRKLLQELDTLRKNSTYVTTLAHDGLQLLRDGLSPGEDQRLGEALGGLQQRIEAATGAPDASVALDVAEFLLARLRTVQGSSVMKGSATMADDNRVVAGTFAFVGPETYFRAEQGGLAGLVRAREGARYPVVHPLELWTPAASDAFFSGQLATIPADPTQGKALRLRQTSGTVLTHVGKGGVVAYAILVVGLVALILIAQKIRDILQLSVERRERVEAFLRLVAQGARSDVPAALASLRPSTRELFEEGWRNADQPKAILEERLQALLLGQRLHFERRLPLLAVIATAAPLMGLLGTVVGMVKTFALITVFGTGNAGKLSSGISEVLVATEIGLAVAIPTLVAHGFLAHRIHKSLAMLERQALEFATAVEQSKTAEGALPAGETVTA